MSKKNKRNKVEKVKSYSSDSEEITKMIKILVGLVVVLGVFYLIFAVASGEFSKGKKNDTPVEIQDVEILAGNIFSRSNEEYYVLMYDFDATDSITYNNIYNMYVNYNTNSKMYIVDLSKKFNTPYLVEDRSLVNISSIDNLKVVNGTLIKVSKGKGISYNIGKEDIEKTLFK